MRQEGRGDKCDVQGDENIVGARKGYPIMRFICRYCGGAMMFKKLSKKQFSEEHTYSCSECRREVPVNMVFKETRV